MKNSSFIPFLILTLLFSGPLWAQTIVERDVEVAERETEAQEDVEEAKRKAEEKKALEEIKPITFQEILKDPDNIDLNIRYAKQQINNNNFMSAAGTLERILMLQPDMAQARLFYAIVLFRLDNLNEAERELRTILKYDMPEDLREDVELYLNRVRMRRKNTAYVLRQSNGYEFDDNRNAAPSSKRQLVSDAPVGISGTNSKRDDTSFLNITNFRVSHDPGFQAGHRVFGEFTYFLQEQTMVDNLDIQSFRGEFGMELKSKLLNVTPSFFFNHLFLSRESFLRSQGLAINVDRSLGKRFAADAGFAYEYQDYLNISESTTAIERKGPQYSLNARLHYLLTPNQRITFGLGYLNKNAKAEFNSYERLAITLQHLLFWKKGIYVINGVDGGFDYYEEPETAVASYHRRDKSLRYRATLGIPLAAFKVDRFLPRVFRGISVNLTYEYYRALSTITNFTYHNNKYQAILTKTWEF